MEIVLKKVKKKDFDVIKSLAKALGFEIETKKESPYNQDFVNEILEAEQSIKDGKGVLMSMEEIEALCK